MSATFIEQINRHRGSDRNQAQRLARMLETCANERGPSIRAQTPGFGVGIANSGRSRGAANELRSTRTGPAGDGAQAPLYRGACDIAGHDARERAHRFEQFLQRGATRVKTLQIDGTRAAKRWPRR